jgi:hypothetical protein
MGKMRYADAAEFDIDDRTLLHLRIVHMNKLRRSESFVLHLPDPNRIGTRSLWMSPAVAVEFRTFRGASQSIDGRWIDAMMTEAGDAHGLVLRPEAGQP